VRLLARAKRRPAGFGSSASTTEARTRRGLAIPFDFARPGIGPRGPIRHWRHSRGGASEGSADRRSRRSGVSVEHPFLDPGALRFGEGAELARESRRIHGSLRRGPPSVGTSSGFLPWGGVRVWRGRAHSCRERRGSRFASPPRLTCDGTANLGPFRRRACRRAIWVLCLLVASNCRSPRRECRLAAGPESQASPPARSWRTGAGLATSPR
jgi:hypothetical protein